MIAALLEGVRSAALPCSLTLLIPGIAVVLAARKAPVAAAAGFVGSLLVVGWLRAIGYLGTLPVGWIAVAIGTAMLLAVIGSAVNSSRLGTIGLGAVPGVGAAWIWQPCVGVELGSILNRAPTEPLAALPLLSAYLVGVAVVVLVAALVRVVTADTKSPKRFVTVAGVVGGAAVAMAIAFGIYRDVVGWLALVSV